MREIVDYAENKCITIVPEIEMPGHAMSALASYPELLCTGGPFSVPGNWGIFVDLYCAGNTETCDFLENLLLEILEIFPGRDIHIGGDECPTVH
ncbi:MAG: family 20 glycosylhydrolase [candidate division Zixibacteria bacterium]|nr:family 20 glycosylhydrolase [candidate division Zixibacteria bacterium]